MPRLPARHAGDWDLHCGWFQPSSSDRSSTVSDRTLGASKAQGSEEDGEMKRRLDNVSVALESARKDADTHRSKAAQGDVATIIFPFRTRALFLLD
jgi:hypothetical protein